MEMGATRATMQRRAAAAGNPGEALRLSSALESDTSDHALNGDSHSSERRRAGDGQKGAELKRGAKAVRRERAAAAKQTEYGHSRGTRREEGAAA